MQGYLCHLLNAYVFFLPLFSATTYTKQLKNHLTLHSLSLLLHSFLSLSFSNQTKHKLKEKEEMRNSSWEIQIKLEPLPFPPNEFQGVDRPC